MLAFSIFASLYWYFFIGMFLLTWGVGLLISVLALVSTRSRAGWMGAGGIVLLAVFILMNFGNIKSFADNIVFQINFARLEPHYLEIIAEAERFQSVSMLGDGTLERNIFYHMDEPLPYIVDQAPPVRVAFYLWGIGDNWDGVVHDPTGIVRSATGWSADNKFTASPEAVDLFNGDVVSCKHVKDAFYRCWFT